MKIVTITCLILLFSNILIAQGYWQQRVEYEILVDFDVINHQYDGKEKLTYFNNSPDTLQKLYYHLYLNAFQPNSMMDARSSALPDPDGRVGARISELKQDEIGYIRVNQITQDGTSVGFNISETLLEVDLSNPIAPGDSSVLHIQFEAQIPLQIRRTGRNSLEGIDYSISQWYPKVAEYDDLGWHTSPYIAREFFAPWGDFDVKITIDKDYVLAGTGILQNPNEIGFGYEEPGQVIQKKSKKVTWHFKADNVHDFVWAADTEYIQTTAQVPNGPLLRFFYVPGEETANWEILPEYTVKAFEFVEKYFGQYGWSQYSIIQGGDGGMEYPMATLVANKKISGLRSLTSLVGVVCHELIHSWYQGMLATDESRFAWMDEGFTDYVEELTKDYIFEQERKDPFESIYSNYKKWVLTGNEEPASTHSDHFSSNQAYRRASYTKGALAVRQLGYVIGEDVRDKGMLEYHKQWAFKHPDMNDFVRIMEEQSGIELSWYFNYWINTTKFIDYELTSVEQIGKKSLITITRLGEMPMPIDLEITMTDGSKSNYYIPLHIMLGQKTPESGKEIIVGKDWPWTHPTYQVGLDLPISEIEEIVIDPTDRLMDVNRDNNVYSFK